MMAVTDMIKNCRLIFFFMALLQPVSDVAHRLDAASGFSEFLTQGLYVHIERSGLTLVVHSPGICDS